MADDVIKQKCFKCNTDVAYNEKQDKENNELFPIKMRLVVVDSDNHICPVYAIAKDKQKLIDQKYIKFMCLDCMKKA